MCSRSGDGDWIHRFAEGRVNRAFSGTLVSPLAGLVRVIVGGVVSAPAAVVKLHGSCIGRYQCIAGKVLGAIGNRGGELRIRR